MPVMNESDGYCKSCEQLAVRVQLQQDTIRDLQATVRGLTESYRNLEMMAHDLHDSISGSLEDCTGMGKD
jgi:hypothetical protein